MRIFSPRTVGASSALLAALLTTACATDTVTAPASPSIRLEGETTNPSPTQSLFLCKVGAVGTTATFSVTANGGTVVNATPTVAANAIGPDIVCQAVWNGTGLEDPMTAQVTITETAWTAGQKLDQIVSLIGSTWTNYGTIDGLPLPASKSITIDISRTDGGVVWFKNITEDTPPPPPPPPAADKGCTPGYWKQSQHFDSWVTYTPGQSFASVFENAFPGMSLLQVVSNGGGGLNALGRHTVAYLLNTTSGVNTKYTTAEVIAKFNAVYPGTARQYENLKNEFEALNERGCPLN